VFWDFWRKRENDDLRRLISAYRSYLKAERQADEEGIADEGRDLRYLKGGFGKACQVLFNKWPTMNESRQFERILDHWLKKTPAVDQAFVFAFNEFLKQKKLSPSELEAVIQQGREAFKR